MRLVSIAIERYRSIAKAPKIRLDDYTVLLGPNNEGKSNILNALTVAMLALSMFERRDGFLDPLGRMRLNRRYDWNRDFPLHQQGKKGTKQTSVITVEVELDETEIAEFHSVIKSKLNGLLAVAVTLGAGGFESLRILKKGRGGKALTSKSRAIASFIASRLRFEHIPAVRTADEAQQVVESLVAGELRHLEEDPEYQAAVKKIADLQGPLLQDLSLRIRTTLAPFLDSLTNVEVLISTDGRNAALRTACEIYLDDGARTLLKHKGDGVQSLAALALMRDATTGKAHGKHLVVAIEEPESHLHPGAVHTLHTLLGGLSRDHQVLVTTHNPLFVDKTHFTRNVIVRGKKAVAATSLAEIREVLGVRVSDNLQQSELVLLVEGECDRVSLQAILPTCSTILASAFRSGTIAIESLFGGNNLAYRVSTLRASVYPFYVFLDADSGARSAASRVIEDGLMHSSDVTYTTFPKMKESELEDLIRPEWYAPAILAEFGVPVAAGIGHNRAKKKWSARIEDIFVQHGQPWDDGVKRRVKTIVAQEVAKNPLDALLEPGAAVVRHLAGVLEQRLGAR